MYKINDHKMYYDMADGQAIVINFSTGVYYGMSSLGSFVLDQLLAGATIHSLVAALGTLPECPPDIEARITEYVQKLMQKEILIEADEDSSLQQQVPFIPPEALEDGFILAANEFAEAQELIMADPIHDVDVNMGWPIMKES